MGIMQRIKAAVLAPSQEASGQGVNQIMIIDGNAPILSATFKGNAYDAELVRTAVDSFARHASKLKPEVQGAAMSPTLKRALLTRPNPWQTTSQFIYRLATIYMVNNTALILPIYHPEFPDELIGYRTTAAGNIVASVNKYGDLFLKFEIGGKDYALPYEEVGVLTRHQFKNEYLGSSNSPLGGTMAVMNQQAEALRKGLQNSGSVRFIAGLSSTYKEKTLDDIRRDFVEKNLGTNNGGLVLYDSKITNLTQVKSDPTWIDEKQVEQIKQSVFGYFGTSRAIVNNSYTESEYNAFYEGLIEPWAIQLSEVLTSMTFTDKEISYGNRIMFSANRLQYASNQTKLQVSSALLDRGVLSRNEVRDIWQLPPIEGGDDYRMRGEYKTEEVIDANSETETTPVSPIANSSDGAGAN